MKRALLSLIIVFIVTLILTNNAHAAEMNFSVKTIIPENQIDNNKSYFNLKMEPEQEQTLEVLLSNDAEEEITVEVNINQAITNSNGVIDYNQKVEEHDDSLKHPINEIVEYEEEIKLEAKSELTYPIKVNMPNESIEGMLLGGINFKEKDKEEEVNKEGLENKFAYTVGLQLLMDESDLQSDLKLHKINPTQINYRNAVTVNLQNPIEKILAPLKVKASVYKEKGEKPLFKEENDDVRMAPNSNFDYAISWDNKPFDSGTYRLELEASNEDDEWSWTEYFEIEVEEAKEYNDRAVELENDYTKFYIIGGIILALLLAIIFFWLGRRSNNREGEVNRDE